MTSVRFDEHDIRQYETLSDYRARVEENALKGKNMAVITIQDGELLNCEVSEGVTAIIIDLDQDYLEIFESG